MKRLTIDDAVNNDFYKLFKWLFSKKYQKLSNDSKIAYCLLRDRYQLSISNNWVNKKGEIYLIYSNKNLMELLQCSEPTLIKVKKELIKHKLIEQEQQGLGKPNLIFLNQESITNENIENLTTTDTKDTKDEYEQQYKYYSDGSIKQYLSDPDVDSIFQEFLKTRTKKLTKSEIKTAIIQLEQWNSYNQMNMIYEAMREERRTILKPKESLNNN